MLLQPVQATESTPRHIQLKWRSTATSVNMQFKLNCVAALHVAVERKTDGQTRGHPLMTS